jgi:hypothetical protein
MIHNGLCSPTRHGCCIGSEMALRSAVRTLFIRDMKANILAVDMERQVHSTICQREDRYPFLRSEGARHVSPSRSIRRAVPDKPRYEQVAADDQECRQAEEPAQTTALRAHTRAQLCLASTAQGTHWRNGGNATDPDLPRSE